MFRSYIQPVVIMTTIPFGLIGGVIGHIIMGKSLSLLSMFGLVALAGIVVNDAIVLIEAVIIPKKKNSANIISFFRKEDFNIKKVFCY